MCRLGASPFVLLATSPATFWLELAGGRRTLRYCAGVDVRLKVDFGNEAARLSINGVHCPCGECGMQRDHQGLPFARWQRSSQLAVAATCRNHFESGSNENCSDVTARELFKPQ